MRSAGLGTTEKEAGESSLLRSRNSNLAHLRRAPQFLFVARRPQPGVLVGSALSTGPSGRRMKSTRPYPVEKQKLLYTEQQTDS
jgi:hypothetical protein